MSAVESWFAPAAAIAEPLPARRKRAAPAAAKPKKQQRQRRNLRVRAPLGWMVVLALVLTFVALAGRTAYRPTVRASSLAAAAKSQTRTPVVTQALRGTIFDRMGTPLAIGEQTTDVIADPMQISDPAGEAAIVAK